MLVDADDSADNAPATLPMPPAPVTDEDAPVVLSSVSAIFSFVVYYLLFITGYCALAILLRRRRRRRRDAGRCWLLSIISCVVDV